MKYAGLIMTVCAVRFTKTEATTIQLDLTKFFKSNQICTSIAPNVAGEMEAQSAAETGRELTLTVT